ncbi:MAG TPA: hypothetical protein VH763_13285 [Gemmatimonadales bacterium]|jgi:hypothetical protein
MTLSEILNDLELDARPDAASRFHAEVLAGGADSIKVFRTDTRDGKPGV